MKPRTGSRSIAEIPRDVMRKLNRGEIESASLVEGLAVDLAVLLKSAVPTLEKDAISTMRRGRGLGITKRLALAAFLVSEHLGAVAFDALKEHRSDTVRAVAAFVLGVKKSTPLRRKLASIRPLADDGHFAVREWAWIALRDDIARDIEASLSLLASWTLDSSANIRRFAAESTRPRGVWCRHVPRLKEDPSLGRPILDPLLCDPSRYVQISVSNWLNDASKSRPDWVVAYLEENGSMRGSKAFDWISRRALRSVR